MDTNPTIAEIDKARLAAYLALENKDFATYMGCFSDDLKYKQLNGKIIDKRQLSDDTKRYFDRITTNTGTYDRLNSSVDDGLFTETIIQKTIVIISVFIFFSKKWTVEREGIYKWKKVNGEWKISDVEITSEKPR